VGGAVRSDARRRRAGANAGAPASSRRVRPRAARLRVARRKNPRAAADPWTEALSDPRRQVSWLAGRRSIHAFPVAQWPRGATRPALVDLARRSQLQEQPGYRTPFPL